MFIYQNNEIIDLDTNKSVKDLLEETEEKEFIDYSYKEKLAFIFFNIFYIDEENEDMTLFYKYLNILGNMNNIEEAPEFDEAVKIILSIQNNSNDLVDFLFYDIIYETIK
jgi:hypothetical protein